jgi:hypothetical protein
MLGHSKLLTRELLQSCWLCWLVGLCGSKGLWFRMWSIEQQAQGLHQKEQRNAQVDTQLWLCSSCGRVVHHAET